MKYDLVVIGGGPAGEKAAAAAAYFGKRVALVEKADAGPGGAAVHTGTLPSKTLREAALYLTGFKRRELYHGIQQSFSREIGSIQTLSRRLSHVVELQSHVIKQNLKRHQIELIKGHGEILDSGIVTVNGRELETNNILIATGSRPRRPAQFDFSDPDVYDSDSILGIERLPDSLAVIGGGVIGSEYASVFATLGVDISIIESRPRLLSFLDEEISDHLMEAQRESGITLHLSNRVERLERSGSDLKLTLKNGQVMNVDKALVSAGREGNTENLGLRQVGVETDARGRIVVDEAFQTNIPGVYASGDVIGHPALASASMEQGRMAVAAMFGIEVPRRDWDTLASGIYTIPEAAFVGLTEQELKTRNIPYVVGRSRMKHNTRGQIIGDSDGFIKLLFHAEDRILLGAHLICEQATELIHIGQAVMRLGGTVDYFVETLMTFPSLSIAYKYAAYAALPALAEQSNASKLRRPVPLK